MRIAAPPISYRDTTAPKSTEVTRADALLPILINSTHAHLKTSWINEADRIILNIRVAIETLWVSRVVTTLIWVRLVEPRVPSIISSEHGFIRAVVVTMVA